MRRVTNIKIEIDGVTHRLIEDGERDIQCRKNCSLAGVCLALPKDRIICGAFVEDSMVKRGLYHFEKEENDEGK